MIRVYLLFCIQLVNILCKATMSALAEHFISFFFKKKKRQKSKRLSLVTAWGTYCCVQPVYILHTHTELPEWDERETVTFKFQAEDVPSSVIYVRRKLHSAPGHKAEKTTVQSRWLRWMKTTNMEALRWHKEFCVGTKWVIWPFSLIFHLSKGEIYLSYSFQIKTHCHLKKAQHLCFSLDHGVRKHFKEQKQNPL